MSMVRRCNRSPQTRANQSLTYWYFAAAFHLYVVYWTTSASVKSYQLVKVISAGRAPGKNLILASRQTVSEWVISLFWGRALGKSSIFVLRQFFSTCIINHSFKGHTLIAAACLLLACWLPAAAAADDCMCQMGPVPVGFESEEMIWVSAVFQSFH